jgi:hypothetical protein
MIDCNVLTEFKSRKYRFGFKYECVRVNAFIPLGKLLEALYNNYTDADFSAEFETSFSRSDLKLYTDREDIANFIRVNFCKQP